MSAAKTSGLAVEVPAWLLADRLTYSRAWLLLPDAELRAALEAMTPEAQRAIAHEANRVRVRVTYIEGLARAINKRSVPVPGEDDKP